MRIDQTYQEEISITDILQKLWHRRGLLMIIPVIFFLGAGIFLLVNKVTAQTSTVYFVELLGIDKSTYPNGTRFSPQDLLIPEVLARAAGKLGLSVTDKLRDAIQVEYGIPTTEGIQQKYQLRLKAKNISLSEIEQINNEYTEELKRVFERGLKIIVDHTELNLSSEQGTILASTLPGAWSEIFSQKYRILIDTRLDNTGIVNDKLAFLTTSDILTARHTLTRIKNGLRLIGEDNRLKMLVSQNGMNSSDMESRLESFNEIYFRPMLGGLFENPDQAAATFLVETQLRIEEISSNIGEIDRSIVDINSFRAQTAEPQATTSGREAPVQLGDNTIQQIIDLSDKASMSSFLQQSLLARRDLAAQKAALQTEIDRSKTNSPTIKSADFIQQAAADYSVLVKEYSSLLLAARQACRQDHGELFKPLNSPQIAQEDLPVRSRLILFLSVMVGFLCAMILALSLPFCQPVQDEVKH